MTTHHQLLPRYPLLPVVLISVDRHDYNMSRRTGGIPDPDATCVGLWRWVRRCEGDRISSSCVPVVERIVVRFLMTVITSS